MTTNEVKKSGQYIIVICVGLSTFALGTSMAWSSPAGLPMKNGTYIEGVQLTEVQEAWAGALMPLGATLISIPSGFFMQTIGRRRFLLASVIPYTVGWALLIWPTTVVFLYLGRFLTGVANGMVSVAAPVYMTEIAQVEIRGTLCCYLVTILNLGIVLVYVLGSVVSIFVLSIVCGAVPLVFAVAFFFMPETPLFYVTKGREAKAKKAMLFLRGPNYNIDKELQEIHDCIATAKKEETSICKELTSRAVVRSLVISLGLMMLQPLSGIDVITFYSNSIFRAAGSYLSPGISSIILGSMQCITTLFTSQVVDRLGRKILLVVSSTVMAVCIFLVGAFFYLIEAGKDVSELGWLPLVSLCFYMTAYSLGLGSVPRIIVAELFTSRIRGAVNGAANVINWGVVFLTTKFFSDVVSGLGRGPTFWMFGGFLVMGTGFYIFVVTETKGKTAEEIQEELGRR